MRRDKLCEKIIEKNYAAIFRYCKSRLHGQIDAAEECTQEVFLLFLEKQNKLDLEDNISGWLYASADRITKKYLREIEKRKHVEGVGLAEVSGLSVEPITEERNSVFDSLTDDEYKLLKQYYATDRHNRSELAKELGISVNTLYQRIHAIKAKCTGNGLKKK